MEWPELLDEMEGRLAATERTLLEGGPPPATFAGVSGAGPLPEALRHRAARILDETLRLSTRVRAARDRLSDARRRAETNRPRGISAYVDTRT